MAADAAAQILDDGTTLAKGILGDIGLVGEVNRRFNEAGRTDQRLPPLLIKFGKGALGLAESLSALSFGLGVD